VWLLLTAQEINLKVVGSSPTFGYSYSKLNQSSCSFALFGAPSCCFLAVLVFGGERATGNPLKEANQRLCQLRTMFLHLVAEVELWAG
jgi:hypothetical protein